MSELVIMDRGERMKWLEENFDATKYTLGFTSIVRPNFYWDVFPSLTSETGSWIRANVLDVYDGDTVKIEVLECYNVFKTLESGGSVPMKVGSTCDVRFVGIDCAETHKESAEAETSAQNRNRDWLSNHNLPDDINGINLNMAFELGGDAKVFVRELIKNKEVIIDVETVDSGKGPGADYYGRMLGDIHLPLDYKNSCTSINVNRSLLQINSRRHREFSLADINYLLASGVLKSKFPVLGWGTYDTDWVSPSFSKEDPELEKFLEGFKTGEMLIDGKGDVWCNSKSNQSALTTQELEGLDLTQLKNKYNGNTYNADLKYHAKINPLIQEGDGLEFNPYEDMPTKFHIRIGDVTLVVPPLSINIVNTSKNEQVNTLRNRNAIQVQSGHSDCMVTMELFFHDVEAINGVAQPNPFQGIDISNLPDEEKSHIQTLQQLWPEPYYTNGFRALLAQFKKAPFVPVYNEFLETTYGITSVGLESIQVSTVPGFPNTLAVTLTMLKFDHSAYMPDTDDLGEVTNWPIFRWYVQDALQPRYINREVVDELGRVQTEKVLDPHHIYIDKIISRFNSDISFEIANEGILQARVAAIKRLRDMYSPAVFKDKNDSIGTTIGQFQHDYDTTDQALKQIKGFNEWKASHSPEEYPNFYDRQGCFDGDRYPPSSQSYFIFDKAILRGAKKGRHPEVATLMASVYGNDWSDKRQGGFSSLENGWNKATYLVLNGDDDDGFAKIRPRLSELTPLPKNCLGGWVVLPIFSEINRNLVEGRGVEIDPLDPTADLGSYEVFYETRKKKGIFYTLAIIKPSCTSLLEMIRRNGEEGGSGSYEAYEDQIRQATKIADISEDTVPMDPVEIEGLHILSVSAASHNVFSKLQIQELESPTLQYLGGQETYFTIKAQTKSRETVAQLRALIQKSQRLARDYRIAINSGFLNINNDLINFMGVRSILIEQMEIATIPGTPELLGITLSCTAFDKTQRERESIKQIQLRDPSSKEYTLEKFQEYFQKSSNNEEEQWTIFDYKLRQQELYPDLDLPTWLEFEKAIPYLNCGFSSLEELDQRVIEMTGDLPQDRAKYVDPDFYIHTEMTNQVLLQKALRDKDVQALLMHDAGGVKSVDIVPKEESEELTSPNIEVNQSFWIEDDALREQLAEDLQEFKDEFDDMGMEIVIKSVDTGYKARYDENATPQQGYDLPISNMEAVSAYSFSANDAVDRDKFIFEYLRVTPTKSELSKWGIGNPDQAIKDPFGYFKNPSYEEVINEIGRNVDLFFTFPDANDTVESPEDFIYGKDGIISTPRITRRKIINVLKGIIHHESTFRQFYNIKESITIGGVIYRQPMPLFPLKKGELWKVDGKWIAVGLMQMVAGSAGYSKNLDEARRMAWDWKYNLKVGISKFAEDYNYCCNSKDINTSSLPLDYSIIKYNTYRNKDLSCNYYYAFRDIFDKFYASPDKMYADPKAKRNPELAREANSNLIKKYMLGGSGTKDIPKLTITFFRNLKFFKDYYGRVKESGVVLNVGIKGVEAEGSSAVQNGQIDPIENPADFGRAIARAINTHLQSYGEGSFDPSSQIIAVNITSTPDNMVEERGEVSYTACVVAGGSLNNSSNDYAQLETIRQAELLPNKDTITSEALYRSFNDSLEFDMKGRLVRAFPSFQMFIIDEGRWTFWHKLWDNLYGYNAIQSIDVIKDREIVADTLVMQMTNVYSNLSTKQSTYKENYSSFHLSDLAFGSAEDKADAWHTLLNIADEDIIEARAEHLDTLMLKAGARIHLRMGYGSNADNMPITFNGTITEMDSQEIITIIAQGDGLELTNKMNAKPGDDNGKFFDWKISEPRELICSMMTTRGNWLKGQINKQSQGIFFKGNPLGIAHFGNDMTIPPAIGVLPFFRMACVDYGEAGANIYSANGYETFSQWICYGKVDKYKEGSRGLSWGLEAGKFDDKTDIEQDSPNVKVYLYDKTLWDIVNLLSMAVPDYIAAVHPFELRSTLFYGKPMWGLAYQYAYLFRVDPNTNTLQRVITNEIRKPYSQFHTFNGFSDILANKIKATETNLYNNVIVAYGGKDEKTTPIIHADTDIYTSEQKTAIVKADIALNKIGLGTGIFSRNYWTSEYYSQVVGANALKNYMNHMYDGELILLGYPSIKPHDKFYLEDNYNDMQGVAGVRRVIHHMSFETGFITNVTPDCISVVDDMQQISLISWQSAIAGSVMTELVVRRAAKTALDRLFNGLVGRTLRKQSEKELAQAIGGLFGKICDANKAENIEFTNNIMEALRSKTKLKDVKSTVLSSRTNSSVVKGFKQFLGTVDDLADAGKAWNDIGKTAKLVRTLKGAAAVADVALGVCGGILLDIGVSIVCEGVVEMYRRYRHNRQAVIIMPLKYRGKEYTAGINGHKGLIYGESLGKWDKIFEENWLIQMFDGIVFEDDRNPGIRSKPTSINEFLND